MTREELVRQKAQEFTSRGEYSPTLTECFIAGAEWEHKRLVEKACKCYCDDICDKSRCGMCFHKYDGEYQVKNSFQYNECDVLKMIRKAMEE